MKNQTLKILFNISVPTQYSSGIPLLLTGVKAWHSMFNPQQTKQHPHLILTSNMPSNVPSEAKEMTRKNDSTPTSLSSPQASASKSPGSKPPPLVSTALKPSASKPLPKPETFEQAWMTLAPSLESVRPASSPPYRY
jgi:hypothetical protein